MTSFLFENNKEKIKKVVDEPLYLWYYIRATEIRFHSQVGKATDCNSVIIGSSPVGTSIAMPRWRNW